MTRSSKHALPKQFEIFSARLGHSTQSRVMIPSICYLATGTCALMGSSLSEVQNYRVINSRTHVSRHGISDPQTKLYVRLAIRKPAAQSKMAHGSAFFGVALRATRTEKTTKNYPTRRTMREILVPVCRRGHYEHSDMRFITIGFELVKKMGFPACRLSQ